MTVPCIGVLLAGGASLRMGCDKAILRWQGKSLLDHMLGVLDGLGLERSVVSGDRVGIASIPDLHPGRGPLGGIASVAMHLPDAMLLVVPVDMPCITAALLRQLLNAVPEGPAHFSARPLPMRIKLDQSLRAWFCNWLNDPNAPRAVHRLHAQMGSLELTVQPSEIASLVNANTPAEWESLQTHGCAIQQLVRPMKSLNPVDPRETTN